MEASTDFVLDGQPHGDIAGQLAENDYDQGLYRPYLDRNGNKCFTVNVGNQYSAEKGMEVPTYEKMTFNEVKHRGYDTPMLGVSNATILRKDDWIKFDRAVIMQARPRLRAWQDLAAANTFTLDGMSSKMLEHETVNDPGEARVDMDGMSEGRRDIPLFQLEGMPLPITSSNFWFSERDIRVSRKNGNSLSTLSAGFSGRRVAETIEKTTLGVTDGITYGTAANYSNAPKVSGYTTYEDRITTTVTTPTGSNSGTTVSEILAMRSALYDVNMYGPYIIYNGTDWDRYLDDDHFRYVTEGGAAPITTLRKRLIEIEDISSIRRADYLTPTLTGGTFDLLMVALGNPEVARAVVGMPLRTIQWPSRGGMRVNFKVMTIMAPQIRSDQAGNCGINHASVT